ncbi:MAG: hypothetical protein R2731_17860 [Nocardioides sp.]
MFTLPVCLAGGVVLLVRPSLRRGLGALCASAALAPLMLAWLNRDGPGRVCRVDHGETLCGDRLSPWPLLAAALVLVALAVVLLRPGQER